MYTYKTACLQHEVLNSVSKYFLATFTEYCVRRDSDVFAEYFSNLLWLDFDIKQG